jgi:hypothetical protein
MAKNPKLKNRTDADFQQLGEIKHENYQNMGCASICGGAEKIIDKIKYHIYYRKRKEVFYEGKWNMDIYKKSLDRKSKQNV